MDPDQKIFNERERLEALNSYHILDTAEEKDFDDLTMLASAICQTPVSMVSLIDDKRQWLKSAKGVELGDIPKEYSFCARAIETAPDITVVSDANDDERFADNPFVTGPTKVIFYAGVPLVNEDGFALGSLCVIDFHKRELTDDQIAALKILGKQVMDKLEIRRKVRILEKTNKELLNSNVLIQKFASMAAHDIKNPLTSMLLSSQALKIKSKKIENEGFEKLIDLNINSTKDLLFLVDEMLAYSKSPSLLIERKKEIDLNIVLQKVLALVNIPVNFEVSLPEETSIIKISIVAFEQIMLNLLSNAIRYNDKETGIIKIRFKEDTEFYNFEVEDNGMGISAAYHQKIFGNNFTLDISDRDNNKGTGIGLSTVKELLIVLNGSITVSSTVKQGTTFSFKIKK